VVRYRFGDQLIEFARHMGSACGGSDAH